MKTLTVALFAAALPALAVSQSFVNGNFEGGSLDGWTLTPTANGQTLTQDVQMFDIDGPGPLGASLAGRFQVGQVTFTSGVQAGISLTQTLNLLSGVEYVFSFNWAAWRLEGQASNAQGGVFSLVVNGDIIATQEAGSTSGSLPRYGFLETPFTPTATGNYEVGIRITRPFTPAANLFQYVDNVQVVPEPATMAALALGAGALVRRRRKSS
jgi:hypothetical protein